jgi:transposase
MFCRLKDYRRIATRNDQPATTFLGAIYLGAAVIWWSGVLLYDITPHIAA